jgi:carbamoyl-phosphate synthase large subunit
MHKDKIRVAVSGAGGGVGQSIIKALYDTDYEVIALDGEPLGTGLYATAESHVIPYANSPSYIDEVLRICQESDCRLFFPGLDAELPVLSKAIDRFKEIGTEVIVSSLEVVEISDDKLRTYTALTEQGIAVPKTVAMASTDKDAPLPYPFIVKKRVGGARSKDVYLIKSEKELQELASQNIKLSEFVAQEYIEGDEYTCGSINLNSECMGVLVMRRTLRDGDTYKCFVEKNEVIETEVRKIMKAIKPFGACNVQLRLKDGKPYVFEINARCSGTTAARALCGFNEPKMIADYLCLDEAPKYDIKEQAVLRYWNELVVPSATITEVEQTGRRSSDSYPKL